MQLTSLGYPWGTTDGRLQALRVRSVNDGTASLEDQLTPGTLEYAIDHLVEDPPDLSLLDGRYWSGETGREAIAPKLHIKRAVVGYSGALMSSRSWERARCKDVMFMALSFGIEWDRSTIAAFLSTIVQ